MGWVMPDAHSPEPRMVLAGRLLLASSDEIAWGASWRSGEPHGGTPCGLRRPSQLDGGGMRDVLLIDMAGWGMIYCAAKALGFL